jgi:hypothetical protein
LVINPIVQKQIPMLIQVLIFKMKSNYGPTSKIIMIGASGQPMVNLSIDLS